MPKSEERTTVSVSIRSVTMNEVSRFCQKFSDEHYGIRPTESEAISIIVERFVFQAITAVEAREI